MTRKRFLISELETGWFAVGEIPPPEGTRLLVATVKCGVLPGYYTEKEGILNAQSQRPMIGATHWRLWPRNPNLHYKDDAFLDIQTNK